jgi:imidazolonepropionase-like amidohydrolase
MAIRIDADLLIPGRGEPVPDGTVVLDGAVIAFAGPRADAPPPGPSDTTVSAPVVLPGLWDCHGHFMGMLTADITAAVRDPVALRGARITRDAGAALDAGFTSVREAGGLGIDLARAIDEGTVRGPNVYAPGAILSTTGGHGDLHDFPIGWVHDACSRVGDLQVCDGVDECIRAVRLQLRQNARVIKICASGGVMSEIDHPIHQQFNDDELRAIVETAALSERVVMAHCHGKPGIMAALRAGVKTIEHGTYLDEEACAAMVELDVLLVPTRYIVVQLMAAGLASGMTPANFSKLAAIADIHAEALARAHEAGVRIACGTDIFQSAPHLPVAWGHNGAELGLMVEAGLSPLAAIEAATANGPDTLGPQAPRSGLLAAGYDADVITVAADPLADISVLGDAANVTGVWKAGVRVKEAPAG